MSRFRKLEIWEKSMPLLRLGVDVARCACAIDMVVGVFEHLDVDLSKREIESRWCTPKVIENGSKIGKKGYVFVKVNPTLCY